MRRIARQRDPHRSGLVASASAASRGRRYDAGTNAMTWQDKLRGLADRRGPADSERRAEPAGAGTDSRQVRLAPGLTLVADDGTALDAEPVGNRGWLVSRRGGSAGAE